MKKVALTLLLFLLMGNTLMLHAQSEPGKAVASLNYIDSIRQQAKAATGLSEKIRAYEKWLPLSIFIHDHQDEKDLETFAQMAAQDKSGLAQGIYYLNRAYFLAENMADYNKGLELCLQAREIFERLQAKPQLVMTYNRLVMLILWNEIARKKPISNDNLYELYLSRSLQYSKELRDTTLIINTLGLIGSYYAVTENNNAKALQYFYDAEKLLQPATPPDQTLVILESIPIILSDYDDESRLLEYMKKCEAHPYFKVFGYGRSNMYRSVANFYLVQKKDYNTALRYAQEAYNISLDMGAPEYIAQGEKRLYEIYKAMKNEQLALYYHEKYKNTEDSFSRERFQRTYAEYDVQKKENTIIQQKFELTKKNNLLYGSLLLLLATLGTGYAFFLWRRKSQQLRLQELTLAQKTETTRAVMTAEENERKRIAEELHDSVAQKMVVAKLNLEALGNSLPALTGEQQQVYNNISSLVSESAAEVRNLSHTMMPQSLAMTGLVDAVKNFTDKIDPRKLQLSFNVEGSLENIDSNRQMMVYRILRECIQNVIKHAKATALDISIIAEKDAVDIIVEDNGIGFDKQEVQEGLGMQSIRSRVDFLNGKMEVTSQPGKGTVVALYIPSAG